MKRDAAGYTLLEMLVALVVFGLVMAGLAQAFRYGLTALAAGQRAIATPADLAAVDMALRRMIETAQLDSLRGGPGSLAFTTNLPEAAGPTGGLQDVALQLGIGGVLVLHYAPHPPGLPIGPLAPMATEVLASGVEQVQFAYLTPQAGTAPVWTRQFSGAGLPLLIRMHLSFAGRDWPDLVAAPSRHSERPGT
jgi:general secretion pathway protein J